jgi:5-methylcytosine-specific restriction endonuclease McrA
MIVPRAEHGDYRLRNLITLCQSCRSAVTAAQKAHPTYMRTWTSIKDSYKPVMPGYLLSTQWVTTTPGDPDKTWHLWVYAGKKRD